jgi:hypothetical protein
MKWDATGALPLKEQTFQSLRSDLSGLEENKI